METILEKTQKDYHLAKKKAVWLTFLEMTSKLILVAIVLSPIMTIYCLYAEHGALPSMTEADIAAFTRIEAEYSFSPEWNFIFAFLQVLILYWMSASRWFRRETATIMHYVITILVAAGASYFSIAYSGMLYGLSASLSFLILFLCVLVCSPAVEEYLFSAK